jgi:biopolymer transport protein ExbD
MGRRKKPDDVELNLAAMLDMAFQLLTFFILTFKPAPVEGEIDLRLPPPEPITNVAATKKAGENDKDIDPAKGLESLIVSIFPTPGGTIGSLAVGEQNVAGLPQLKSKLNGIFKDPDIPFKQVIIQVGSALRYEELMSVIDICTQVELPGIDKVTKKQNKLTKLSFVELPEAAGN